MKGNNKWLWSHRTLANLFVVLVGIAFYLCLSNFDLVRGKVAEIVKIFTPFIAGFALAYLLNLPMRFFERRVFRRFRARRGLSILTSYLLAAVLLAVLLGLVLPQLVQSVMALAANVPAYLRNLNDLLDFLIDKFHVDKEIVSQLG